MLWFGGNKVMVCQRSGQFVSKCVIVMDRIWVCWPCVPGVMAFLSYLVICVVGIFVESAFFSFFFLCKVWMGAFGLCTKFLLVVLLLCWWMVVVFFCLETIVTGLIYLLQVRQCHFWRGLTHFW